MLTRQGQTDRAMLPSGMEAVRPRVPGGSELARSEEYDLERAAITRKGTEHVK